MIEQIIIENYKSIRNARIPMRSLNVLIGPNGAGKSNFISFFDMVLRLYNQQLGRFVMAQGGADRIFHQGCKHSSYMKGLIDFANTNAFSFELRPAIGNKAYIEYTCDYFNNCHYPNKDYGQSWNKCLWDKAVEESNIADSPTWRAGYLKNFIKGLTVYHFHDTSHASPPPCGRPARWATTNICATTAPIWRLFCIGCKRRTQGASSSSRA